MNIYTTCHKNYYCQKYNEKRPVRLFTGLLSLLVGYIFIYEKGQNLENKNYKYSIELRKRVNF